MTPTVSSSSGAQTASGTVSATQSGSVDKNMFLQLLVAQLRNQDPLNPTDGTQFLGELAQFQQLEQATNTGEDITAIRQDLDKLVQGTQSTNGKS
jgi:flagellar basal-body rod modification protein FlgD